MEKLKEAFYLHENVLTIAAQLIGKILCTNFNNVLTCGKIVETEAYNGIIDKASHAYGGRRTKRTEIMYASGGVAYVYLCYGIHHLFNVVTNAKNVPHAVLVRAIEPTIGIEYMRSRFGREMPYFQLGKGPGNVAKALGIQVAQSGTVLSGNEIWIADNGNDIRPETIASSPRIGVDYAQEDAQLPYRFFIKNNKCVSGKKPVVSH